MSRHPMQDNRPPPPRAECDWQRTGRGEQGGSQEGGGGALQTQVNSAI